MEHNARRRRFVVGYDGSPSSRAAVREAARSAGPDGHLVVVHAYVPPSPGMGWPLYRSAAQDAAVGARRLADQLLGHAALENVHWTSEVVAGPTAEVIDAAARNDDADAIFIGSRGAGRASALLGSVAHQLLHIADRPVVVITERAAARSAPAAA
jgi:nucleotide-binding universal stress UspA family protein